MAHGITKDVWVGELDDRPGAGAEKLEAISRVEVDLEFVIARRAPEKTGTGVVFTAPLRGEESVRSKGTIVRAFSTGRAPARPYLRGSSNRNGIEDSAPEPAEDLPWGARQLPRND